jgi:hypothetical protein
VRVALERGGEVRAERRMRGLVVDEVLLGGARQRAQVRPAREREVTAQALALERAALGGVLEERVEPREAVGLGRGRGGDLRIGGHGPIVCEDRGQNVKRVARRPRRTPRVRMPRAPAERTKT